MREVLMFCDIKYFVWSPMGLNEIEPDFSIFKMSTTF